MTRKGGMRKLSGGKKPKKYLRTFGVILLALACIAGVELAVCRIMEPALFQRITQPVVQMAHGVWERGQNLTQKVQSAVETYRQEKQEERRQQETTPVSQEIQEPQEDLGTLLQDPEITRFTSRQGQEVLTGGVVELVYFNQGEEPWASAAFGPDPIRGFGCGPTAMSMVVSSLEEQVVDPAKMARLAYEQGYCAPGSGSYLSIVEGMGRYFGLTAQSCGEISARELCQRLASGQLLVALMGPGHFTTGGHFIVLRGATLTGQVLVADPNSRERSLALWDPQLILDELSASRANGAPLWSFSVLGGGG